MRQKGTTAKVDPTEPTPVPAVHAPLKRQRVLSASLSPPPHSPALPTPAAMQPTPHSHPEQTYEDEGKARKSVFGNVELRQKIFGLLDRSSLLSFQRVDKIAVAGVAQVIYRKIPESLVSRMSRSSPRREIYADAVRVISRSPPPRLTRKAPTSYHSEGTRVEPEALLATAYALRMAYQNLHSIECRHPASDGDDAYVISLDGDDGVTVTIDRRVCYDIGQYRAPKGAGAGDLLRLNGLFGREDERIRVRYTISLHAYFHSASNSCEGLPAGTAVSWKTWLFHNPNLDRRVTSITMPDALRAKMGVTDGDTIAFLSCRRDGKCEPVTGLEISLAGGRCAERIADHSALVGPEMRALHLDSTGAENHDWQAVIAACNSSFPQLTTLTLSNQTSTIDITKPLSGLPHLLCLRIVDNRPRRGYREPLGFDPCTLAFNVSGVGAQDCVFLVLIDKVLADGFHSLISKIKRLPQQYNYLRTTSLHDLDLWNPEAVLKGGFDFPPGEAVRRQGWVTLAESAAHFDSKKLELLSLFEQGKAAVEAFQALLTGTVNELAGTEGNVQAQGEILSRRFKDINEPQQEKLEEALEALVQQTRAVIREAYSAREFAEAWQEKQRSTS